MGVTISTQNGSVVHQAHNIRDKRCVEKEPHIDPNGVHETWVHEGVREAYDRLFGESAKRYNEKQSRPERRIKSYYNKVLRNEKMHPCYEMIIGIYGRNDDGTPICSNEMGKDIMREFVDNWQQRNPNLELIGAYYHADEAGEPHVHIDYIPVAHGYKKGMDTQAGLVKAFGEQGLEMKGNITAQIQWEARENDYFTALCESRGLTVDHPKKDGIKHLDTETYKKQQELETTIDNYNFMTAEVNRLDKAIKRKGVIAKSQEETQQLLDFKEQELKKKAIMLDERIKNYEDELRENVICQTRMLEDSCAKWRNKCREIEKTAIEREKQIKSEVDRQAEILAQEKAVELSKEMVSSYIDEIKGLKQQLENTTDELSELKGFCNTHKIKDNYTVYDAFKAQKNISRGISR